jgi:hypothetical protein
MQAVLLERHRVIATVIVLALFVGAVAAAVFRVSAIEEGEASARQQAAVREAAQLKADFEANKASIVAAIQAALARGRVDEAEALLKKYRPVAGGALEDLNARWEREKLAPTLFRGNSGKGSPVRG